MTKRNTLKETLISLVGTAENPIPPRVTQLILGGGDLGVIKFYDLTAMDLDRLRFALPMMPKMVFEDLNRRHPCIIDSAMITSDHQAIISEACQWLGKFCKKLITDPLTRLAPYMNSLSRNGDYAYQSRLQNALETFLGRLSEDEGKLLNAAIDERAIPLTDCGIYDISATRSTATEIELYIPLKHINNYPVWLVIVSGARGNFTVTFNTRLTSNSEAIRLTVDHYADLSFTNILRYVTGGIV